MRFLWRNRIRFNRHDVLTTSGEIVLLLRFGQHDDAKAAHGRPEYGAQTSYECQSQSGGCREAEHFDDQYVPALIGSDVSRIQCPCDIDQLGQSLDCERTERADLCA